MAFAKGMMALAEDLAVLIAVLSLMVIAIALAIFKGED